MKLVSFTVAKFRSINTTRKIQVGQQTVLVGPNNEGKSNLLRALVLAMEILKSVRTLPDYGGGTRTLIARGRHSYDWERDFPQGKQEKEPNGQTKITLEFALDEAEVADFRAEIKSSLNGTLPIAMTLRRNDDPQITVVKQGRGGTALTEKAPAIARFISRRINFEHIPAVRTASSAEAIVNRMVEQELAQLDLNPDYVAALQAISDLQQPTLERLSNSIGETLQQFLPEVRGVSVQIPNESRNRALRSYCSITVDDGTPTLLQYKGDGVQSLAALGIMRHASVTSASGSNSVIAIEEPESHLHPEAIHKLRVVLAELATRHQIVVTTHNPLFVDRTALGNNVIVKDSRAQPARTIEELRATLGVRASDNLRHAELVLVVEGESDKRALQALLASHSKPCLEAFRSGALAVDSLGGGSNLPHHLTMLRHALCQVYCFLDNDEAGRNAFERARLDGTATDLDVSWATREGRGDSELEDLFDASVYSDAIKNRYGVSLAAPEFHTAKKWSERMSKTFARQGKRWDERIEKEVKTLLADIVCAAPAKALQTERVGLIEALARTLETRLTLLHS